VEIEEAAVMSIGTRVSEADLLNVMNSATKQVEVYATGRR